MATKKAATVKTDATPSCAGHPQGPPGPTEFAEPAVA